MRLTIPLLAVLTGCALDTEIAADASQEADSAPRVAAADAGPPERDAGPVRLPEAPRDAAPGPIVDPGPDAAPPTLTGPDSAPPPHPLDATVEAMPDAAAPIPDAAPRPADPDGGRPEDAESDDPAPGDARLSEPDAGDLDAGPGDAAIDPAPDATLLPTVADAHLPDVPDAATCGPFPGRLIRGRPEQVPYVCVPYEGRDVRWFPPAPPVPECFAPPTLEAEWIVAAELAPGERLREVRDEQGLLAKQWLETPTGPDVWEVRVQVNATWHPGGALASFNRETPALARVREYAWDLSSRALREDWQDGDQCGWTTWDYGPWGLTSRHNGSGFCEEIAWGGNSSSASCLYDAAGHVVLAQWGSDFEGDECGETTRWLWEGDRPYAQFSDIRNDGLCGGLGTASFILERDAQGRTVGVLELSCFHSDCLGVEGRRAGFDGDRLLFVDSFGLDGYHPTFSLRDHYERRCASADCDCSDCPVLPE